VVAPQLPEGRAPVPARHACHPIGGNPHRSPASDPSTPLDAPSRGSRTHSQLLPSGKPLSPEESRGWIRRSMRPASLASMPPD
jgi:hypothetical protein